MVLEKRRLGKTDMHVSVLGFGASEIGEHGTRAESERILNSALELGVNIIDTAECYGNSEALIGEFLSARRDQFYLFTKCGHKENWDIPAWSPRQLTESIENSLRRMKTEYVDLIQLHTCSEKMLRDGKVIESLQKARKEGKARYIGYSGDGAAARYAIECAAFDSLQCSVGLADQEAISLILPLAREKEMGVIAKRPISNVAWQAQVKSVLPPRSLSEKIKQLNWSKLKNRFRSELKKINEKVNPVPIYPNYSERFSKLDYEFLKGDLQTAVENAMRFTLSVSGIHTLIIGTTKAEHFAANVKSAQEGPLQPELYELIRARWLAVAGSNWKGLG